MTQISAVAYADRQKTMKRGLRRCPAWLRISCSAKDALKEMDAFTEYMRSNVYKTLCPNVCSMYF